MFEFLKTTVLLLFVFSVAPADDPPMPSSGHEGVGKIRNEALAVRALVSSRIAREFLDATARLPRISGRTLYVDEGTKTYYGSRTFATLPQEVQKQLTAKPVTETFYYTTKYGTPVAYVRALELCSRFFEGPMAGLRILDFGYGSIGQLRLMASCGADVVGVEVDPMLRALYDEPGDQGRISNDGATPGRLTLVHGRFPEIASQVGVDYDLITSKNTLKNGFFHPERPVPKERLVNLGVEDAVFVETVHNALKPGGVFLIYNICPAPSKPGEPYKHWADGRCPFPRVMLESAGFEVVEYDRNDDAATRAMAKALAWDRGEYGMDLENDLFGSYMIAVKRAN